VPPGGRGGGQITDLPQIAFIVPIVPDAAQIEPLALALAADASIAISASLGWLAP